MSSSNEAKVLVCVTDIDEGTEVSYVLIPESLVDPFHDMALEREMNTELLEVEELNNMADIKVYLGAACRLPSEDEDDDGSEEEDPDDEVFGM